MHRHLFSPFIFALIFLFFFFKQRSELFLATITPGRVATSKRYCFTRAACLPALYIKRARANIILLWIFIGTERSQSVLFVPRLKRAPGCVLHSSQYIYPPNMRNMIKCEKITFTVMLFCYFLVPLRCFHHSWYFRRVYLAGISYTYIIIFNKLNITKKNIPIYQYTIGRMDTSMCVVFASRNVAEQLCNYARVNK